MRIQFVPLPRMNPFHPSSRHIFTRAFHIDNLYSSLPALWTWSKIFKRSRGDTIVLETAPATPPAMNAATTGSAILLLILKEGVFWARVSWKAVSVELFNFLGRGSTKGEMGIIIITSGVEDSGRESFGSESLFESSMWSLWVVWGRSKLISTGRSLNHWNQ